MFPFGLYLTNYADDFSGGCYVDAVFRHDTGSNHHINAWQSTLVHQALVTLRTNSELTGLEIIASSCNKKSLAFLK